MNARDNTPLRTLIADRLAAGEDTAAGIAQAIGKGDTPSIVVKELNAMRTDGQVECEQRGKKKELVYWLAVPLEVAVTFTDWPFLVVWMFPLVKEIAWLVVYVVPPEAVIVVPAAIVTSPFTIILPIVSVVGVINTVPVAFSPTSFLPVGVKSTETVFFCCWVITGKIAWLVSS